MTIGKKKGGVNLIKEKDTIPYREIKEYILERFILHNAVRLQKQDLVKRLRVYIQDYLDRAIINIILYLHGKRQDQLIPIVAPDTWRDMIKLKYKHKKWMRWITKYFPIKYHTRTFNISEITTFPELDLPQKLLNEPEIKFLTWEETNL